MNNEKKPYDHGAYPHHGAPGGPMDAWDCNSVREISLQWGTRLGKTFFAQVAMLWTAANDPAPMMHANTSESVCLEVIERTYMMVALRPRLEALMAKRPADRRQNMMEFRGCRLIGAWSKSVSTLADKNVKNGHAGEIDKWVHPSTSKEAHPLELFSDRFKDYWATRKVIYESTPTVKGQSPIEDRLQAGTNCRFHVPCRHCRRYQVLDWKRVKYEKPASGRLDPALAYRTACYECRHCEAALLSSDRNWMIRRGVWCPQGCEVDDAEAMKAAEARMLQGPAGIRAAGDDGAGVARREKWPPKWQGWASSPWIKGTPYRDGPEASYQLSSLYALSLPTWGDIAKEWVKSIIRVGKLRNFINQWLAETWEPRKTKSTVEQVAERLGTTRPARLVPAWARFLTLTVDRQAADGGFVKWVVMAHGPEERSAVVAYGICSPQDPAQLPEGVAPLSELEQVQKIAWDVEYPAEDGGPPFRCSIAAVDSGWNTRQTYEFCNARDRWFALKGDGGHLGDKLYEVTTLKEGVRSGAVGQVLIKVGTEVWEEDLDDRLHNSEKTADTPGCLSLCEEAAKDWGFMDELLNGVLGDAKDRKGELKNQWKKKNENDPNDYRDAVRYGECLGRAWLDANDGAYPARAGLRQPERAAAPAAEPEGYVRKRSAPVRRPRR